MIHAYDEYYLNDAMQNLGEAVDFAVNCCNLSMDQFFDCFITSGFAHQFENGVSNIISGTSGTELVMKVLEKSGLKFQEIDAQVEYDYSCEYWCGWILAYYQWYTKRSFQNIRQHISMQKIQSLYPVLHEAPEEKFVEVVNAIIRKNQTPTRLQTQRKNCGYSQKQLSEKSGVSIRSIQQYEQRAKDINKASVSHLIALAKTLGVGVEDLIEFEICEMK